MLLKILWDQNICFLCLTPLLTSFFSYLQSKLQCNDDSISGTVYLKFIIVENFPQDTLFDIVIILVSVFFQYGQKKKNHWESKCVKNLYYIYPGFSMRNWELFHWQRQISCCIGALPIILLVSSEIEQLCNIYRTFT